ncbi:ribosome maturation factor RimP [Propionicimonas sp.]|uniref:ribosome maturation factor RimP n=1 Tax=Propionicimonas sp. TaxID=1955623 RepID=UPI0017B0D616|nr:ribosome maturation factor RimP [Propionicimonas sp.]MBU3976178.1 ribosome maturation factor RimP [Actinomycetota bacterium]MBA3020990.1 ribosome maturation factor RimP [Propionicimonas sp.]MBU3985573.1 ribosome maturation factor RimP [Actinomycetota bacterium]MBU4008358.1 ribosome maturation factor RimP [Actinomycetota bacterium]MBU4066492.1 ribosome maturation factor RimP [Actinomycetota bacterium]
MDSTAIGKLLTPVVAAHDLEIDRLEITAAGKRSVVRIFLDGDGPAGVGPSMDQIAQATRSISVALDDADVTKGRPYTLEVSSRGVGRPLTEAKHFRRNRGRLVAITTADEPVTGRIAGVSDEVLELEVAGVVQEIALAAITTAQVQVEMNRSINKSDDEEEEV